MAERVADLAGLDAALGVVRRTDEVDARGVQLGERLVAVTARLVAGVVAGTGPLEDCDDLVDLGAGRPAVAVQLGQALAILGAGVLEGVDHRERLLAPGDVGRWLARR